MALGSNLAGVARVAFEAQTEKFYAELQAAETRYKATLARMEAAGARSRANLSTAAPAALTGATAGPARQPAAERPLSQTPGAVRLREQRAQARAQRTPIDSSGIDKATKSTQAYTKAATGATAATTAYGTSAATASTKQASMTGSIIRSTAAFGGVLLGFEALRQVASNLADSQRVAAQTAAVIESTGGVAGVTAKHVDELALSLQKTSRFEDETIASGENMLLTFKNIRNQAGEGNDVFDQTTRILVDMAQAFNTSTGGSDGMQRSSIALGKALNDPIKGVTALRRVGVTFTEQQREQIKTMVESGNVMGAQKMILKELNSEFGGSAAAAAGTFGGQLTVLKNQVLEWVEVLATDAIPAIKVLTVILKGAFAVLKPMTPLILLAATAWGIWKLQILLTNSALYKFVGAVIRATVAMVAQGGVLATLRTGWAMLTAVMMANPFVAVLAVLVLLGTALVIAYQKSETFRNIVSAAFKYAADAAAIALKVITFQIRLFLKGLGLLAEAATHIPFIGDKFKGVKEKIDGVVAGLDQAIDFVDELGEKDVDIKVKVTYDFTPFTTDPFAPPVEPKGPKREPQFGDPDWKPDPSKGKGGPQDVTAMPGGVQLREAQARRDQNDRALKAILAEEIGILEDRLKTMTLTKAEEAKIQNAIAAMENERRSIDQTAQDARDQADKDAQDRADAAADRAADRRAKRLQVPEKLQAQEAEARYRGAEKALKQTLLAERRYLRVILYTMKLTAAERKQVLGDLDAIQDDIDAIDADRVEKAKQRAADRAERQQLLFDTAMARAALDPETTAERRLLKREERRLQARIKILEARKKLSNDELKELELLYSTLRANREAQKELRDDDEKDRRAKEREAMNAEFRRMVSEFSSNVMAGRAPTGTLDATTGAGGVAVGQNVTVVQNFKAPTEDRMREARMAKVAAEAQFLG